MAYINYNLQAVGESQLIIMQKSAMTRLPMHARPSVAAPQFSHFFSQEIIENCAILTSGKQSICPTPPTPPPPPPSTFPPQLTRRMTLPHTHTHACTLCHAYSAPIRIIFPFSVFFSTFFCGISLASANALARGKKKKTTICGCDYYYHDYYAQIAKFRGCRTRSNTARKCLPHVD